MTIWLRSFMRKMEVDRVIFYSLLSRVWGIIVSPITVFLIATRFTPTIQGFYYTFGPILGLQTFVELGIGLAIAQFASHEWSGLKLDNNGMIVGDADSISRLGSLAKFSIKWYSLGAFILVLGLTIGGCIFFSKSPDHNVIWRLPWISICVLTGVSFLTIPLWSLLEGCNQVSNVYLFRLIQVVLVSLVTWLSILFKGNLWTTSIATFISLLYTSVFLYRKYRNFFKTLLLSRLHGPRLSWLRDILPLQWRVALAWMVGYFLTSLFVPVLFYYHGSIIAGRMGMTWALVIALQGICSAWVSPKLPQLAIWAKEKEYDKMDQLFFRQFKILLAVSSFAALTLWMAIFILFKYHHFLSYRLLSPLPTAILLVTGMLHALTLPMSLYLIAHKKMPFLSASIAAGIISGVGALILGKYFSSLGVSISYMLAYLVAFPLTAYIWQDCRKKWHRCVE